MTIRRIICVYLLAYTVLAAGDLGSTLLGEAGGATEFNPALGEADGLNIARFVWLSLVFGALSAGMLAWALARGGRADAAYMRAPWRASISWLFYLNPFAASNQPRSIFHWVAIPVSLLFVRAFAICNNLAIAFGVPDILTPIAHAVGQLVPEKLAYVSVVTIVMAPFWIGALYLTPHLLRTGNRAGGAGAAYAAA